MKRRIEMGTSHTAELTCICRAGSSLEKDPYYRSEDYIALQILPSPINTLLKIPFYRTLHFGFGAPKGMYEYIITRTKYIDSTFENSIENGFTQVAILGAGYDTRAIRLSNNINQVRIFEFDSLFTQQAKIKIYQQKNIQIPEYLRFVSINFEKENLLEKFEEAGFMRDQKSLFIIEGTLMYLEPSSVKVLFKAISEYMGKESIIVFDYIYLDVLRHEKKHYGGTEAMNTVIKANESYQFGLEKDSISAFLSEYHLQVLDHLNAKEMEKRYFTDQKGRLIHHINDIHCLVTAKKV